MSKYWLDKDGESVGPYEEGELIEAIEAGHVKPHQLVHMVGGEDWVKAATLVPLPPVLGQPGKAESPLLTPGLVSKQPALVQPSPVFATPQGGSIPSGKGLYKSKKKFLSGGVGVGILSVFVALKMFACVGNTVTNADYEAKGYSQNLSLNLAPDEAQAVGFTPGVTSVKLKFTGQYSYAFSNVENFDTIPLNRWKPASGPRTLRTGGKKFLFIANIGLAPLKGSVKIQ